MAERIPVSTTIRVPLQAYLSSDHLSPATGKTIAITISKNGAAYANPSGGATNAVEIGSGSYYVDLTTTDTGTVGPLFMLGQVTGVDNVVAIHNVFDPNAQVFPTSPTAGTWGEALWYLDQQVGRRGTAQAGTSTTITLDSGASTNDSIYVGYGIKLISGTGSGQSGTITAYNGTTKVATILRKGGTGGWDTTPDSTTVFLIERFPLANIGLIVSGVITDSTFTVPVEASGEPSTILAMIRRLWERGTRKRIRDRNAGTVTLRNAADSGNLETCTQTTTGGTVDTIGPSS